MDKEPMMRVNKEGLRDPANETHKSALLLWIYMKAICKWFVILSLWRFYDAR